MYAIRSYYAQQLQGYGCGKDTRRTAARFFFMHRMRRGVGTEHHFGMGVERHFEQCFTIFGTLGDRFAEEMGFEHPAGDLIERDKQVVNGNTRIEVLMTIQHIDRRFGRNMLHDDLSFWTIGCKHLVNASYNFG